MKLKQNKPSTRTEALLCLEKTRNYLLSISETADIDYNPLYKTEDRNVGNKSNAKQINFLLSF